MVDLLLRENADQQSRNGRYNSALEAAISGSHEQVARVILSYTADPLSQPNKFKAQARSRNRALYLAAYSGYEMITKLLLQNGADAKSRGAKEYVTALGVVGRFDFDQVAEILIRAGADVDADCDLWGAPLAIACYYNSLKVVKVLLNAKANVNGREGRYGNALRGACVNGNTEMVSLLLAAGANVNFQSDTHGMALWACIQSGILSCVELLLTNGADVNLLPKSVHTGRGVLADLLIRHSVRNPKYVLSERVDPVFPHKFLDLTDGNGNVIRADGRWREDVPGGMLRE